MTIKEMKEIVDFARSVVNRKGDQLRQELGDSLCNGKITRTEYDLIWDLTTNKKYYLARHYLNQAIAQKPN